MRNIEKHLAEYDKLHARHGSIEPSIAELREIDAAASRRFTDNYNVADRILNNQWLAYNVGVVVGYRLAKREKTATGGNR